jgi:hypothetical protein
MASFYVYDTLVITSRKLFVLAGYIAEGTIRAGMKVHIRLNSSISTTAPIYQIEFARRYQGREDICLCILYEDDTELAIWQGLNIGEEIVEVAN